ncbi:hypothetical protein ACJU26_11670 [Acidithiobacillus sp. M4-SHS-6]|uniref:hypothetical protein n=1 Tax=Acidithiobacillus sp. M4-SHS-6 TaxID=3383024 RepID=UPI0039BDE0E2
MTLERNDIAFQIFIKLLENEQLSLFFLRDEMEKIDRIIELSYKASDAFIKKSEAEIA